MSGSLDIKYMQRMGKVPENCVQANSRKQNFSRVNLHDQMMITEKIHWKMDRIRLGQEHHHRNIRRDKFTHREPSGTKPQLCLNTSKFCYS